MLSSQKWRGWVFPYIQMSPRLHRVVNVLLMEKLQIYSRCWSPCLASQAVMDSWTLSPVSSTAMGQLSLGCSHGHHGEALCWGLAGASWSFLDLKGAWALGAYHKMSPGTHPFHLAPHQLAAGRRRWRFCHGSQSRGGILSSQTGRCYLYEHCASSSLSTYLQLPGIQ